MDNFKDDKRRRHFSRTQKSICKFFISVNETRWYEAELYDISASGAKFFCSKLKLEKECFVKIDILSGMSEFTFKTKAEIKRVEGDNIYAVAFTELNKTSEIMLDEILNSNNKFFTE